MPLTSTGSSQLEAGVAEPPAVAHSRDLRLQLADDSVREDVGEGVIGCRYVVGTLQVTAATVRDPGWAQRVVDDLLQPSEQTQGLSGTTPRCSPSSTMRPSRSPTTPPKANSAVPSCCGGLAVATAPKRTHAPIPSSPLTRRPRTVAASASSPAG
ncbi:MAG: hypothetical protein INH41_22185 [Myxococcaceae bacterium]|nr:hypothetical protein [Myxococcaceae bacterium]MCA3015105.1 hypothetical protein [Myxococcaceae bacterium]